jgi:alanyl-tRNA synthetase
VVVLATVEEGKVILVAGVTKSATSRIKAGDIMKHLAAQVDGKGGGRPDMAQGGGSDPSRLAEALAGVPEWVEKNIA